MIKLRIKRAACRIVGHSWGEWLVERNAVQPFITRVCSRCPAYEVQS